MSGGEYPFSLARVIDAVHEDVLRSDYKRLWRHIFELSRRPEGCTAPAERLAQRLGMNSVRTVETMRWELEQFGLVRRAERRLAWYVTVPADCIPSVRATDPEIVARALCLTTFLRPAVERRMARLKPGQFRGSPGTQRRTYSGVPFRPTTEQTPDDLTSNHGDSADPQSRSPSAVAVLRQAAAARRVGGSEVEEEVEEGEHPPPSSLPPEGEAIARDINRREGPSPRGGPHHVGGALSRVLAPLGLAPEMLMNEEPPDWGDIPVSDPPAEDEFDEL